MAEFADFLAAGIGSWANTAQTASNYLWNKKLAKQEQGYALERMANEQAFNAQQAQIVRDWQEQMASTNYQRAIADMEAAGLNPASLVGSSPSGALAPSTAAVSAGAGSKPSSGVSVSGAGMSALMSSAINGMIAKDRDAAKYLADEMRDNARHAHKMEEIREWKAEKKLEGSYRDGKDTIPY